MYRTDTDQEPTWPEHVRPSFINIPVATLLHLPKPASTARVDATGALLATVFTTAALLVATNTRYSPLIAVAVLSLIAYMWTERRTAEPLTPCICSGPRSSTSRPSSS
jgi:uncharacterized membrane protein YeiB